MIDDFIGEYKNILTHDECANFMQYFENMSQLNYSFRRKPDQEGFVEDETVFLTELNEFSIDHTQQIVQTFLQKFWNQCYAPYADKYTVLKTAAGKHGVLSLRFQKTRPTEGYHVWHFETNNLIHSHRFITFMVYLNDIEEGGETEFLYLQKRIKPEAGKVLIWPSGFQHSHRGNPPFKNNKYIITGWINFLE